MYNWSRPSDVSVFGFVPGVVVTNGLKNSHMLPVVITILFVIGDKAGGDEL